MATVARKGLINIAVLLISVVLAFLILDAIVVRTDALGGISLGEVIEDEFRIRLLTVPDNSGYGCGNGTALIPNCKGTYYGLKVKIPGFRVSINSVGLRDKEYLLEKKEDAYRIFVLGDSIAWGEGVHNEETFPEVMERLLNERHHVTEFEVFNLGLGGTSTDEQYQQLIRYGDYSPDMVIIQSHPNDIHGCSELKKEIDLILESRGSGAIDDDPQADFSIKIENERLREEVARNMTKDKRCSCVLKYLDLIIKKCSEYSVPAIMYDVDYSDEDHSCFKDVDADDYWHVEARKFMRKHRLSRADAHPNREGHRIMAEELLPIVLSSINSTRPEVLN